MSGKSFSSTHSLVRLAALQIRSMDLRRLDPRTFDYQKVVWPFRVMIHPFRGFEELKFERRGSVALANLLFLLFFLMQVFAILETGYLFNYTQPEKFDAFRVFIGSLLPYLLFCIANWSFCTLMDGEGRFSEIWIATAYSLMPYLVFSVPLTMLSRIMTIEDYAFSNLFNQGLSVWSYFLLAVSVMQIQQYTIKKTLVSLVLSVLGILAILFLAVLAFSLFQQFGIFLETVYKEILFRI